jgi:nucleotide-binding universal stress UspA family protein
MRIILAVDGSKFSDAAIQTVIAQARPQETEIRVLYVLEPPALLVAREMGSYKSALDAAWEAERKEAQALVRRTAELLQSKGLKATAAVEEGDPKSKIVDSAKEWRTDLVVLGSHGRKGLDRFLMGSVSEAVVHHAPCSVEIVRINPANT